MFKLNLAAQPITFRRHVVAILSANFIVASVFALGVAAMSVFQTGSASMGLMLAIVIWLGMFGLAAPASGFIYTIAWPFLRKAKGFGWLISTILGGEGGVAAMWANYASVGKSASPSELTFGAVFGAALGLGYWFAASGASITIRKRSGEPESVDDMTRIPDSGC